jgi:hypothetical protein
MQISGLSALIRIAFEGYKITFNTQKVRLKKKYSFSKKIKSTFESLKSLKMTINRTFGKSLKMKFLSKNFF